MALAMALRGHDRAAINAALEGDAVLATGPGYALRVRVQGCTVVELLRVRSARSVLVGGQVPLERGRTVAVTPGGWRSQGGFVRIAAPFTRLAMRVEAGSDRYRTAVLRARVGLVAGEALRVERGAACR